MSNSILLKIKNKIALFEIIIVILVLMILHNINGPRVNDLYSYQTKSEVTLKQMYSIRSALNGYRSHLGQYPFPLKELSAEGTTVLSASGSLKPCESGNALMSSEIDGFDYLGMPKQEYLARWDGPYTDSHQLFTDLWGNHFRFVLHDRVLYVQSAGADGQFNEIASNTPDIPLLVSISIL